MGRRGYLCEWARKAQSGPRLLIQENNNRVVCWDVLEKEMATHSIILACRIPWSEEPGELQSLGSQRVRHNSAWTHPHLRDRVQTRRLRRPCICKISALCCGKKVGGRTRVVCFGHGQIISPKAAVVQHKIQVNLGTLQWNLDFLFVSLENL